MITLTQLPFWLKKIMQHQEDRGFEREEVEDRIAEALEVFLEYPKQYDLLHVVLTHFEER